MFRLSIDQAELERMYAAALHMHQSNGDPKQLEMLCRAILQYVPNHPGCQRLLGYAYWKSNRLKEAARWFAASNEQQPEIAETVIALASIWWQLGDVQRAHPYYAEATQLADVDPSVLPVIRLGVRMKAAYDGTDRGVPWDDALAYLIHQASPAERPDVLSHFGYIPGSLPHWNELITERLLVPLIQRELDDGDHYRANELHYMGLSVVGIQPHTQEQWQYFFDLVNPLFTTAGHEIHRQLAALPWPADATTCPRVAFLIEGSNNTGSGLLLFENMLVEMKGGNIGYEPMVLTLVPPHERLTTACNTLGFELIDMEQLRDVAIAQDDYVGRLLATRQLLTERGVTAVVLMSSHEASACLAAAIQLAPVQIYQTMMFHSIDAPGVDAYMAFASFAAGCKQIAGRPWRTLPLPYPDPFPPAGSEPEAQQVAQAAKVREQFRAEGFDVLVGTMARSEKLIDPEFMDALAAILKANPNTIFLWFGYSERTEVSALIAQRGIERQCRFMGWVNTQVFARVLDIHLDSFGLPTGLTMYETLCQGGAYLLRYGQESSRIGITAALADVVAPDTVETDTTRAARQVFDDGSGQPGLLPLAFNTDAYIALANRMIGDTEFRRRVGAAGRTFLRQFVQGAGGFGQAFGSHLRQIIADKMAETARQ